MADLDNTLDATGIAYLRAILGDTKSFLEKAFKVMDEVSTSIVSTFEAELHKQSTIWDAFENGVIHNSKTKEHFDIEGNEIFLSPVLAEIISQCALPEQEQRRFERIHNAMARGKNVFEEMKAIAKQIPSKKIMPDWEDDVKNALSNSILLECRRRHKKQNPLLNFQFFSSFLEDIPDVIGGVLTQLDTSSSFSRNGFMPTILAQTDARVLKIAERYRDGIEKILASGEPVGVGNLLPLLGSKEHPMDVVSLQRVFEEIAFFNKAFDLALKKQMGRGGKPPPEEDDEGPWRERSGPQKPPDPGGGRRF